MADSRPLQKLLAHWCNGFVSPCDNSATLGKPSGSPRCGAYIIDTRKGDIVHWIRFEGAVRELFDASFIPGIRAPMCVGLGNPEMRTLITFDGEVGLDRRNCGVKRPTPQTCNGRFLLTLGRGSGKAGMRVSW